MTDFRAEPEAAGPPRSPGSVLYPGAYLWFVFASAMDVMLTWAVFVLGGREVNPVAAVVFGRAGFGGMIAFKFVIVAVVVMICEYLGRTSRRTGWRLSLLAVGMSAAPVVWSLALIARNVRYG